MKSLQPALFRSLPRGLRHAIVRTRFSLDEKRLQNVEVKVADTEAELEASSRLLHEMYVRRGISEPHPSGLRVTPHLVLPTTATIVGLDAGKVVGTAALIQDGPLGLPMDAIYGAELARLRAEGRRMLEVGALCMGPEYRRTGLVYLFYKLMLHFGREQLMMDDAVCAVHPDAEDVYCAALGFERMGPIRQYPGLKKQAVAVALRLNMREVSERFFRRFARWPRTVKNPRWFFEEATFPQLRLPKDALFMERRLLAVLRAAGRLGEAHPESFANLSPAHESYLWRTVPTLRRILAKSRPDLCVAASM